MGAHHALAAAVAVCTLLALPACTSLPMVDAAPATLTGAQIETLLASPDRSASDRTNDLRRKPAEMLAFVGVRPGMVVLDVSSGGGYTTELLARAVGPTGRVYGQSAPRNPARAPPAAPEGGAAPPASAPATPPSPGAITPPLVSNPAAAAATGAAMPTSAAPASAAAAPRTSATMLAERAQRAGLSNIVPVLAPFETPVPDAVADRGLDCITLMFNYHDLGHLGVDRARMNAALFAALKPGGVYVIADHAGRPGTGISESGTLHRVEADFVRREVEAAGFRLAATGAFLRNPNDPRDRNTPEPAQPKDEFVLKFVRP